VVRMAMLRNYLLAKEISHREDRLFYVPRGCEVWLTAWDEFR